MNARSVILFPARCPPFPLLSPKTTLDETRVWYEKCDNIDTSNVIYFNFDVRQWYNNQTVWKMRVILETRAKLKDRASRKILWKIVVHRRNSKRDGITHTNVASPLSFSLNLKNELDQIASETWKMDCNKKLHGEEKKRGFAQTPLQIAVSRYFADSTFLLDLFWATYFIFVPIFHFHSRIQFWDKVQDGCLFLRI